MDGEEGDWGGGGGGGGLVSKGVWKREPKGFFPLLSLFSLSFLNLN